jgi:hypothetical protein
VVLSQSDHDHSPVAFRAAASTVRFAAVEFAASRASAQDGKVTLPPAGRVGAVGATPVAALPAGAGLSMAGAGLSGAGLVVVFAVLAPAAFTTGDGLVSVAGAGLVSVAAAGLSAGTAGLSAGTAGLLSGTVGLVPTAGWFSCSSRRPDAAENKARAHSRTRARAILTILYFLTEKQLLNVTD